MFDNCHETFTLYVIVTRIFAFGKNMTNTSRIEDLRLLLMGREATSIKVYDYVTKTRDNAVASSLKFRVDEILLINIVL